MDFLSVVQIGLQVIGVASVVLGLIAPVTKNKTDDKILAFIKKVLGAVSLNMSDKTMNIKSDKLEIDIKSK